MQKKRTKEEIADELLDNLGRNLRYLMKSKGLTAYRLAQTTSLSATTIRAYADNDTRKDYTPITKQKSAPMLDKLGELAEALDCQVWELLHPDLQLARRNARRLHAFDAAAQQTDTVSDGVPKTAIDLNAVSGRKRAKNVA